MSNDPNKIRSLSFEKLWEENKESFYLKAEYSGSVWKKSLASFFYEHGRNSHHVEKISLSESIDKLKPKRVIMEF